MREGNWLQRSPVWFKLAYFFGALWLLSVALRVVGLNDGPAFAWINLGIYAMLWAICVIVYYIGLMIWRAMNKHDRA